MLILNDRILLEDGTSLVTDEYALKKIITDGEIPDHIKVKQSYDSGNYDYYYRKSITFDGEIKEAPKPEYRNKTTKEELILAISNPIDKTDIDEHLIRVKKELKFFIETDNIDFLCNIKDLIDKMKSDNIVWSGRGSSCASYIMFLIGVHSINPIKYNIDFSEFSKE